MYHEAFYWHFLAMFLTWFVQEGKITFVLILWLCQALKFLPFVLQPTVAAFQVEVPTDVLSNALVLLPWPLWNHLKSYL